ncbi:MAG: thiamine phosphate synthase [Bacteroidota bacterium]
MFKAGLERLHIRKPNLKKEQVAKIIAAVPEEFHQRMIIHGEPELMTSAAFGGYHGKHGEVELAEGQSFSSSAHNWQECDEQLQQADYVFLSPVFDSISKEGYLANFELRRYPKMLQDRPVYALGGITADNWEDALAFGYYGVAVLGSLWEKPGKVWREFEKFKSTAR